MGLDVIGFMRVSPFVGGRRSDLLAGIGHEAALSVSTRPDQELKRDGEGMEVVDRDGEKRPRGIAHHQQYERRDREAQIEQAVRDTPEIEMVDPEDPEYRGKHHGDDIAAVGRLFER